MNTTLINKLIPAGTALLSIAFVGYLINSTTYLPSLPVLVGYLTVVVVTAIAANDYKPRRSTTIGTN